MKLPGISTRLATIWNALAVAALLVAGQAALSGCGGSDSGPCNGDVAYENDATCTPQGTMNPPAGTPAATPKGFLESCTASSECESMLCFNFSAKGTKCSKACTAATAATDCPAPSTGCNGMGVCKAP